MAVLPTPYTVPIQNELPIKIAVYERDPQSGNTRLLDAVDAGTAKTFVTMQTSIRILAAVSGSIIADVPLPITGNKLVVDSVVLTGPNHIPAPTAPSSALLIPADSVPWLVGIGLYSQTGPIVLMREQFWRKGAESFSLPPRSSLQKILRQTAGRTSTSSTTEQVTKELSLNARAGWGPFSAAVSASLSTTSQRTDTVTVREESTSSVIQTFTNEADSALLVCLWQLVERIRVLKAGQSAAAVDAGLLPLIPMSYEF